MPIPSEYEKLLDAVTERYRERHIPAAVQIEVTKRCNLDCVHCYVDHNQPDDELHLSEIKALLEELAALGTLMLILTGGEVFIRKDIWQIIEYARKLHFFIHILTTGTLLDRRAVERLKQLAVGEVHISLYSHEAKVHDAITGRNGSWKKSIQAIRLLREQQMPVWIKMVIMKQNYRDVAAMSGLADQLDCRLQIDANITPGQSTERDPLKYRLGNEEKIDVFSDPEVLSVYSPNDGCETAADDLLVDSPTEGHICNIATTFAIIEANGNVQPCALYPPVGSIREQSFTEIWQQSEVVSTLRELTHETQDKCPACPLKRSCRPCPALSKLESGNNKSCNSLSRQDAEVFDTLKRRKREPFF